MKDEELIGALQAGGKERLEALTHIFQHQEIRTALNYKLRTYKDRLENNFPKVEKLSGDQKHYLLVGSFVDYFFVEAIIVLERNIRNDNFRGTSFGELKSFLESTTNFKCIEWLRKIRPNEEITPLSAGLIESEKSYLDKHRKDILGQLLQKLGEKCKQILLLGAYGFSNQEVAEKLSISSTDVIKTTRNRCRKKLKIMINKNNDLLELFNDYI